MFAIFENFRLIQKKKNLVQINCFKIYCLKRLEPIKHDKFSQRLLVHMTCESAMLIRLAKKSRMLFNLLGLIRAARS